MSEVTSIILATVKSFFFECGTVHAWINMSEK